MKPLERDLDLIEVITHDCSVLDSRLDYFQMDREHFINDHSPEGEIAYDAIMSPVYRIAEDSLHLSDTLKNALPDCPWNDIRGFRNFVAHGYREVDRSIAWKVVVGSIPQLKAALAKYRDSIS